MKKPLLILIAAMWLPGCQLTDTPIWLHSLASHSAPETALTHAEQTGATQNITVPAKVTSIYDNPTIDAEIAASVKDYRLLGYQTLSSVNVMPAVPKHYTQLHIEQGCGIRLLPGAASVATASFDNKQRQIIRHYIERYNQIILGFCENHAGKRLRLAYRRPSE